MFQNLNLLAVDWSLGINVTICGLVIVFSMLILLVIVLSAFGAVFGAASKKTKVEEKTQSKPSSPRSSASVSSVPTATASNDEIIAVIAAAVAAMYEGSEVKPVIRTIKRSGGSVRPAWTAAGIYENTRAF